MSRGPPLTFMNVHGHHGQVSLTQERKDAFFNDVDEDSVVCSDDRVCCENKIPLPDWSARCSPATAAHSGALPCGSSLSIVPPTIRAAGAGRESRNSGFRRTLSKRRHGYPGDRHAAGHTERLRNDFNVKGAPCAQSSQKIT
jgi:hypothetical protein